MGRSLGHLYDRLFDHFGPQGWWPILSMVGKPGFDEGGYHKDNYSYPETSSQSFEIMAGAILTQNTSWRNVEKAMKNLQDKSILNPAGIMASKDSILEECLKPVGYFRVKSKRLKEFVRFLEEQNIETLLIMPADELRDKLLDVNGIGEETADSIILYGAGKHSFVVDAYTRRILGRLGLIEGTPTYGEIKRLFEENLPVDVELYNEYHALLVEHAKTFCNKNPKCEVCPLEDICKKRF